MTKFKITVVESDQTEVWSDEAEGFIFNVLAKFYFINALGQCVWLHTRSRQDALDYIKQEYGGKYALRTAKESKSSGDYSATGTTSRRGTASHLKKTY